MKEARSPNRYQERIDSYLIQDDRSTRITATTADYYELFQDQLTLYNQVDLSLIKQNTTIINAKDLEKEGKNIAEILGNKKNDWAKRTKAILTIQSCLVTPHLLKLPEIYSFLSVITEGLSIQLFDLRSAITKEACKTISLVSEVLQNEFDHQAGNTFVKDISLFKLMESANHLMAEHAHLSVISILYNTCSQKVIKNVLKQALDKHQQIRIYCAEYILLFMLLYPKSILDKFVYDFQAYLKKAIQDSNNEVRRKARLVFMKFNQMYPEECRELFQTSVSLTYQKVIFEDFDYYGLHAEKQNIFSEDLHSTFNQDPHQLSTIDPMNRSMLGQSLTLLGSNGEAIQDSEYENGSKMNHMKTHNFKSNPGYLAVKTSSRQGITSPMSELSSASNMRRTMPHKMSTLRSPGRTNDRNHAIANVPKQSSTMNAMQSVRSTLLAFNNKYSIAPDESSEIAERFRQTDPEIDDNKSTSTYMSTNTMAGRKSPGTIKRTTFTKDIRDSEKDSQNTSNMEELAPNAVKRYTIAAPGGMRSPQRRRIPDITGRGSPKPNKEQKARVNTGLGGMTSPQRPRLEAQQQQNQRFTNKISTTQSSQMAQSTNSSSKIQNSSKFEQLKRNHYTNAKISGRRSPAPTHLTSPTSPTDHSTQASNANHRQKYMQQQTTKYGYQQPPDTPTELKLSENKMASENNVQSHTSYIKDKERANSKIGKGLSYQKQPLRPGSTQVKEDDSMYRSKNLVQQIEPQLQTIQTQRQAPAESAQAISSMSGRTGPTTAPRRSKYLRSMITQHGEPQSAPTQKKEQPPSPRFLSPESTKQGEVLPPVPVPIVQKHPQRKMIPEMPTQMESTGSKTGDVQGPAQPQAEVDLLDLGEEQQQEAPKPKKAAKKEPVEESGAVSEGQNGNRIMVYNNKDIGSHLQVPPQSNHKVNFSMQIPRKPEQHQQNADEAIKDPVVLTDCNLLNDSKIDIISAVNTQESTHPQQQLVPQHSPVEEEDEIDSPAEPIPRDLTLKQHYDLLQKNKDKIQLLNALQAIQDSTQALSNNHLNQSCSHLLIIQFQRLLFYILNTTLKNQKTKTHMKSQIAIKILRILITMLQNFNDPQNTNVNEFINGTIVAIDHSKDVSNEFKSLVQTIKDQSQSNYQSIFENMLLHLSNYALQDQDKQEKNKDAIEICIELLQSCLQPQYFTKSANTIEFLQITLGIGKNQSFQEMVKSLFQHFNQLINFRQASLKSAVNALDQDMKAEYHKLIGIPPSPMSSNSKFDQGNRYCTLSDKSASLLSPASATTVESQIEKECQNISSKLKVEIPPEKPIAILDTPSPPETRHHQLPVPSQQNQQDSVAISMDNIPAASGGPSPKDNLQVPKMSTVKSVQVITSKDKRRKSPRVTQKSVAGSPDRSSIVKQEVDDFSSDVGTVPESDGNVIVNELDVSTIVDPNKMQVIGYENGKQSITVPETKKNEGESSGFEEEEFDDDDLQKAQDLVKTSEVQMEFGKSEVISSSYSMSKTSTLQENQDQNLQDSGTRRCDSAAVLTEQEKQEIVKQQENTTLKNKYMKTLTDEEELTQFNITESNQSHEENARQEEKIIENLDDDNNSQTELTLQRKESLPASESIQSDSSQTQIETNDTALYSTDPKSQSIPNSTVQDGTQRLSIGCKSESNAILSVFEEISSYQTQIRSLDSLSDLDMLLPEIFNSLRENYDLEKDVSKFINDFYNLLLLNEILLHQDSQSVKDNLSMLIDEMAESKKKIPQPIIEDFNTQILYQILSAQSIIKVEDILEVLNLKMLNVSHPFLEEIIQFCAVILIKIKDEGADEDNIKKCHVLTDCLVNWSQNNKDESIKNAALECVHLLQDLQGSLGNQ